MPIKINGSTSGSTTITAPATGTDETIELSTALAAKAPLASPTFTGTPSAPTATAGTNSTALATMAALGLNLITAQTFSGVSAVNVNNCFTSGYENYRVVFRSTGSVSNRAVFRLRASGTDATTGYAGRLLTSDGTGVAGGTISATFFPLMNDNTSSVSYASIDIFQPQETTTTGFLSIGSTSSPDLRFIGGRNTNATSYDGFSLIADTTGNITGTVYVYAYRKA